MLYNYQISIFIVLTTKDNVGNSSSRTYIIKLKFPHIGEYVNYKPDTPNTGYNLRSAQSGYNKNQIIDTSYDPTEWRIMEVDENRNVTKLFGISLKKIGWGGPTGYNNGAYLLNDICKNRYSNAKLGATARSLKIEDIEERMNATGIAKRNAYKLEGNVQYGTTIKYTGSYTKYPAEYASERYSGVGVSDISNGTQVITGNVNKTAQGKMNPNGKTRSDNIYTTLPSPSKALGASVTSITCTQTFYGTSQVASNYYDPNLYKLIFENDNSFWLASRYVICGDPNNIGAYWGFCRVRRGCLDGYGLLGSYGNTNNYSNFYASLVSIDAGFKVKSGSGTVSSPYEIE